MLQKSRMTSGKAALLNVNICLMLTCKQATITNILSIVRLTAFL